VRIGWAVVAATAAAAACAHPLPPPTPGVERVVLVGDSLVNRSSRDHGLLDLVRADLESRRPGYDFELVNAGVNGDCIADIRARLDDEVLALDPAVVVLYWDSDATDVEDAGAAPARTAALRGAYERDLDAVLGALRARTSHVVVAGPTLLGERPRGRNEKDRVLDAYAAINHRLAHEHQATWVDTRHAAFEWLRRHGEGKTGSRRLTEDGEHLNDAGARLVASELAAGLDRSLRGHHEHEAEDSAIAPAAP
jgi:lysophospholipase L1-like esterase